MASPFRIPSKRIVSPDDLADFGTSPACSSISAYIERLNAAVIGVAGDPQRHRRADQSQAVLGMISLLDEVAGWIAEIIPHDNALSRFGNPAFREFYDRLHNNIQALLTPIVVPTAAIGEVGAYLQESFGNRRRIDYGTGHEANFIAFLLCLDNLGILNPTDDVDIVLSVFVRYMSVMRSLQLAYWLEPAGSHGVWGLDDYHFLPFLFGSAQLIGHKYIRPRAIRDTEMVSELAPRYLYFACIAFINAIKSSSSSISPPSRSVASVSGSSLRWHSPMLDDISSVRSWSKVNSGMIKMYRAEVLGKLPVMQHFMFGSLIAFDGGIAHNDDDDDWCQKQFPTCCGIPVPSAIAAARSSPRYLPFD